MKKLTREDLYEAHRIGYASNNAIVRVVGGF